MKNSIISCHWPHFLVEKLQIHTGKHKSIIKAYRDQTNSEIWDLLIKLDREPFHKDDRWEEVVGILIESLQVLVYASKGIGWICQSKESTHRQPFQLPHMYRSCYLWRNLCETHAAGRYWLRGKLFRKRETEKSFPRDLSPFFSCLSLFLLPPKNTSFTSYRIYTQESR